MSYGEARRLRLAVQGRANARNALQIRDLANKRSPDYFRLPNTRPTDAPIRAFVDRDGTASPQSRSSITGSWVSLRRS